MTMRKSEDLGCFRIRLAHASQKFSLAIHVAIVAAWDTLAVERISDVHLLSNIGRRSKGSRASFTATQLHANRDRTVALLQSSTKAHSGLILPLNTGGPTLTSS